MVFLLEEARERGLTRAQLLGKRWHRLGPRVYAPREAADNPMIRLKAAMLRLPTVAVFSGRSAAFLHGLDSVFPSDIEVTLPPRCSISRRVGIKIRRRRLYSNEVVVRQGFRVTSALRTVVDIASRLDLVEGAVILDTALHKRLIRRDQIPANGRLRKAVALAEPATESPMETRLRLLLVLAGLPRPQVQVSLPRVFARADLYYPESRLVIEYDGATHRNSLAADNRRQNRLIEAGYRVLRFSASDVLGEPADVVELVRRAL